MAVQAQYPSPAFRMQKNALDEFQQYQLLGSYYNNNNNNNNNLGGNPMLLNGTVLSEPESELTCNNNIIMSGAPAPACGGDGSRKRNRDSHLMINQYQQPFKFPKAQEVASTSGRSSVSGDYNSAFLLNSHLLQTQDIDTLILLQNEKLRLGLEEARKRHCTSILSVIERQVLNKLVEKENELANATRRNAELEERLKQISAENQLWFNVAKNNEAIASTLKSSLEQILVQNQGQLREGFGDSDSVVADEAESSSSCCIAVEKSESKKLCCKVCEEREVSVLLLPCRHLCLCKDCESKIDACPVCNTFKNASLQIFLS